MSSTPARVLVISDHPADARALHGALTGERRAAAERIELLDPPLPPADGLRRLAGGGVDVLLLDVAGAPEHGLDTLVRARIEAPDVPVVVLAGPGERNASLGAQVLEAGAQDFLTRDQLVDGALVRVLHYAIGRQRLHATLNQLELIDELTGLYNRQAFVALFEHHVAQLAHTRGLLLAIAVLPELDAITERLGAEEGERALLSAARVLRATFRASDVIARLEGGEFAILVLDAAGDAARAITKRLRARLDDHNAARADAGYVLELSLNVVRLGEGPGSGC